MAPAQFLSNLRVALWQSVQSDSLDIAKAAAYSGMLMLFPAFLVLTTLLALVPAGYSLLDEIRTAAEQFLPSDTMSLLQSFFLTRRGFSLQLLLSATALSAFAAWGLMSTLMDGFRRAYRLPGRPGKKRDSFGTRQPGGWTFWQQRTRALMLVPIALVPLALATAIIIFGRLFEHWMITNSAHELHAIVLISWRLVRWTMALITVATVLGALYHFGTNNCEPWSTVVPGAVTASLLWFPITLAFGLWVTRISDYSIIYGSLGTAIATLVWLYLTSFSVLLGAQLNGVQYRRRRKLLIRSNSIRANTANTPTPLTG